VPNKLIKERGKTYGNYGDACEFRQSVIQQMNDLHKGKHGNEIPATVRIMLEDIVHKLARIAVSPYHLDSLRDIQGYTQLIIDYRNEPPHEVPRQ